MRSVHIRFPLSLHSRHLGYQTLRRSVAAGWNELNARQLADVAEALFTISDPYARNLQLIRILLRLPWYRLLALSGEYMLDLEQLITFLLEENTLTRNLFPVLRFRSPVSLLRSPLYGPADGFSNIRFNEFVYAESWFMSYQETGETADLDRLIAVLYRPKDKKCDPTSPDYTGDVREPFNDNLIGMRDIWVSRLPRKIKLAILLWYTGCRMDLVESYENVFSGDKENAKAKQPWLTMIRHVPSDKFGLISQIEAERVHTVLYHLDEMMAEAEEQRREMESQRVNNR